MTNNINRPGKLERTLSKFNGDEEARAAQAIIQRLLHRDDRERKNGGR